MANPKSTIALKVHHYNFGMIHCLFRYSTDAGTSSWLWRFNSLLLRLLGEISLSLLCSHSSWGSALGLDPPLHVGPLRASVLIPDVRGLKQRLIRGSGSLRPGGWRGTVVIIGMWGKPAAAEAGMMLQQPEVCRVFSWGSCPWIMGPWQCWASQPPREWCG